MFFLSSWGGYCSPLAWGGQSWILYALALSGLGLAGVQVFSQGGGLGYVQEPAFGYLVGFIPAGWICGSLAFRLTPVVEPASTSRRRSRPPQWSSAPVTSKICCRDPCRDCW
ncbi:MAG: biotin transporter BioY [Synechococcaceae cyanobacterium RM1_1_27]|nr:biotin transporter BioY [Synechococcaceae cyanobacterium RM1_1_27]